MLTASEAKMVAQTTMDTNTQTAFDRICNSIQFAAAQGKFSIEVDMHNVLHFEKNPGLFDIELVVCRLKCLGYSTEYQRSRYGIPAYYVISWSA